MSGLCVGGLDSVGSGERVLPPQCIICSLIQPSVCDDSGGSWRAIVATEVPQLLVFLNDRSAQIRTARAWVKGIVEMGVFLVRQVKASACPILDVLYLDKKSKVLFVRNNDVIAGLWYKESCAISVPWKQ